MSDKVFSRLGGPWCVWMRGWGGLDDAPPPPPALSLFGVGGGREKMKPFGSFLLLLSPFVPCVPGAMLLRAL